MKAKVIFGNENPRGGSEEFRAAVEKAVSSNLYFEFDGGLGDVILQSTGSDTFIKLADLNGDDHAVIVLFCHNPHAWELFGFHPNADRITILALGFSNRRDEEYRKRHGLPCPVIYAEGTAPKTWAPDPSPDDRTYLSTLPWRYVAFAVTASGGPADGRSVPRDTVVDMVGSCLISNIVPVILGRSYTHTMLGDFAPGDRHAEPPEIPGTISAVDKLSVAGSIELLRRSVANVVCDSSMMLASWKMRRPTYFMCARRLWEMFRKDGIIKAEGYRFGIEYPENESRVFEEYHREGFLAYLSNRVIA